MLNPIAQQIKEMEFDAENELKSLDGIIFNNPSAVFYDVTLIKYTDDNDTKKISIAKWNATKNLRNLMRMFYKQNIFYKNLVKKENVYLAVTPRTKLLNFIWLDDVKLENVSESQLKYMTLVETSPQNFQAWIKLDKEYPENKIQEMKKYLISKLGADKAAAAKIQPMRLPGVYSYKHETPFYVKVYRTAEKELNGAKLLKKINTSNNDDKKTGFSGKKVMLTKTGSNGAWKKYSYYKRELEADDTSFDPVDERQAIVAYAESKGWNIDENRIDIAYIYQLLIRNYSENDIFLYLQQARPDLGEKHQMSDYFERTYLKAVLFKKLYYPGYKLYEHRLLNDYIEMKQQSGDWNPEKKVVENLRSLISKI